MLFHLQCFNDSLFSIDGQYQGIHPLCDPIHAFLNSGSYPQVKLLDFLYNSHVCPLGVSDISQIQILLKMHSSTILVITSAALAFASPIEKRDAEDNGVFKRIANAWGNNGGQWGYTGYRWGASASSSSSSSTAVGSSSSVGSVTSVIVSATPTSTIQPSITQTPSPQIQTSTTLVQPSSTSIPSVPVQTTVTSATLQPTASVTATSSAAPSPSTLTDYASTVVHAHNVLRQKHANTPNVTYDDNLAAYALTLAQTCVFAHDT
jgi:hypothetical protein